MRADVPRSGKTEWPPLLDPGVHSFSLSAFKDLAVDQFEGSQTRPNLFAGLQDIIGCLQRDDICGRLFVNGSYLTHKLDPQDADMVLELSHELAESLTPEQHDRLTWYMDSERKNTHGCDTYAFATHPEDHPLYKDSVESREYWMELFGHGHDGNPKGIAALSTCENDNG